MWDWENVQRAFYEYKIFGVCDWTGASAGKIQIDTPDKGQITTAYAKTNYKWTATFLTDRAGGPHF